MTRIDRAKPQQAAPLFDIFIRAIEVGCARFYPADVIAAWNQGRSVERMESFLGEAEVYSLHAGNLLRGFVHVGDSEVVGLFVDPDVHRRGYGTELFRFAVERIRSRPILVKATLNAVPFYLKMGCRKVAVDSVRRHDRDIYVQRMELA